MTSRICLRILLLTLAIPNVLLAAWAPMGPYGGHAQVITLDVNDPRVLLVGTKNGLLYRSEDAGEHWRPVEFKIGGVSTINALLIDPKDSNIYYAGVADELPEKNGDSFAGVYKSTNAGKTWTQLEGIKDQSIFSMALWPKDSRVIGAGTRNGVFLSTDVGQSWRKISPDDNPEMTYIVSIAIDPVNQDIIYAGTPHLPWKTVDGGKTWISIHRGMIDDSDVFSIAVDGNQPQRVFASACSGIYRSADSGNLWTKIQGIPRSNRRTHIIIQDPKRPNIVYAGTSLGLWKSIDGGVVFHKMADYPYAVKSIAIDPQNPDTLYLATDRSGILKSTDGGKTVQRANNGFVNRNITHFAVVAHNDDPKRITLYASSIYDGDFGGLFVSEDGGRTWSVRATRSKLLEENLLSLAVSPTDDRVLFAGTYSGLLKSTDGGVTWTRIPEPVKKEAIKRPKAKSAKGKSVKKVQVIQPPPKPPLPFDGAKVYSLETAINPKPSLFAGTSMGLFYSEDEGVNWSALEIIKGSPLAVYSTILAKDLAKMVAFTSRGVFLSEDRGQAWRKLEIEVGDLAVYDIALSSKEADLIFAATTRGLYKSTDGGKSWRLRGGGLPVTSVRSVEINPVRSSEVYVLENRMIYRSADGGESWDRFDSAGLENADVRRIVFSANSPEHMFAVASYRGIYYYERSSP